MKKAFFLLFMLIPICRFAGAQEIVVRYMCGEPTEFFYKIRPFISLVNRGETAVSLAGLRVRYYYTKEGYVDQKLTFDWTPSQNASGAFHDGYFELSFASGTLAPGEETGGFQIRIEKDGGGYFDQSDDYSFDPDIVSYEDYEKVTLYRDGTLLWGEEPPSPPEPAPPPPAGDDWLSTDGSRIVDRNGNSVRLTGINWFGFETSVNGFYNFDKINWRYAVETMTSRGFNIMRLPLSAELVNQWRSGQDPLVNHVDGKVNWDIDGVSSLTLLDLVIDYCQSLGMKIMFDMHGIAKGQNEAVWGSVSNLQSAWQWLAERYSVNDTIVAVDLFNEPHGQPFGNDPAAAKWDGSQDGNNWRKAAGDIGTAILSRNPNLLILVEGIECYPMPGYTYATADKFTSYFNWWGGNLRGAADYPVNLGSHNDKLVYSPHDYGPDIHLQPWFVDGFTGQRLYEECWGPNWFYIAERNMAPVLIGEWGGKLANANNRQWLQYLSDFIADEGLHHTFWCLNPNSGDTGGILGDDWNTVDETKYGIIEPTLWQNGSGKYIGLDHEIVLYSTETGTNVSAYYGIPSQTSPPTTPPTSPPAVTPTSPPAQTAGTGETGDVNADGVVNIVDALLIAQYYVGLDPAGFFTEYADADCDGSIGIVDALLVAQYYVGLTDELC
ncbi:MAG: cellulase family glycosylhydrolase [Spirochaetales bacterium]|nr:cellulase family glycosylhydrolase [Spirochaetales bacterium]